MAAASPMNGELPVSLPEVLPPATSSDHLSMLLPGTSLNKLQPGWRLPRRDAMKRRVWRLVKPGNLLRFSVRDESVELIDGKMEIGELQFAKRLNRSFCSQSQPLQICCHMSMVCSGYFLASAVLLLLGWLWPPVKCGGGLGWPQVLSSSLAPVVPQQQWCDVWLG